MRSTLAATHRCLNDYTLPPTRSKRTTNFGFGGRVGFEQRGSSPPPNNYNLPSDFDPQRRKGQIYSFGLTREVFGKVFIKGNPPADKTIPGPGSYNVVQKPGADASKFTFRPKTKMGSTKDPEVL